MPHQLKKPNQRFSWFLPMVIANSLALFVFYYPTTMQAQSPCGSITGPVDNFSRSGQVRTIQIENCDSPFGTISEEPSPFALYINEANVAAGASLEVLEEGTTQYQVQTTRRVDGSRHAFYRHEGNDLVFVAEWPIVLQEEDYRDFAASFFIDSAEAELYLNFLYGDMSSADDPNFSYDRLDEFGLYAESQAHALQSPLTPGTYTLLSEEIILILTSKADNFPARLLNWFIPTAHAQYVPNPLYTMTFTLTTAAPEPTGASSVLFLPGIQASRLYKEGLLGSEDQLWEPNRDQDVSQLAMTEEGQSIEDIYTKDVISNALGVIGIYDSFIEFMDDLKQKEIINDWEPFAYDWRYSVHDTVVSGARYKNGIRSLVDEVERLADDSYTKKVTIIAHSNGGLLAKDLINELNRLSEAGLIDKVVFIGTPHLGTPKAIAVLLHGYDQQKIGGLLIDDQTTREVTRNMPGAYSLLPSIKYLSQNSAPVVLFRDGVATEAMRLQYGTSVNTEEEYIDFLNGIDGRITDPEDISAPYTTNPVLLEAAINEHIVLDDWAAPTGVEVFNLVGVGLKTISALEYREVIETRCTDTVLGTITCVTDRFVRPYAHFTPYGDETVSAISAQDVGGDRYYFDFDKFRSENLDLSRRDHADFLEIDEVQNLIQNIINSTSSPIDYLSVDRPNLTEEYEIISVDSPVRIVATDANGKSAGVIEDAGELKIVETIPNSQYFEFAGTKYLITPKNSAITFRLYGQAHGGFTLTVASLKGDQESVVSELINASTTPAMVASFSREGNVYSNLSVDTDGDEQVDVEMTLSGELIPNEELVSFALLRSKIEALGLAKSKQKALMVLVDISEGFVQKSAGRPIFTKLAKETLTNLSKLIDLYMKKKWIPNTPGADLQEIIRKLRDSI